MMVKGLVLPFGTFDVQVERVEHVDGGLGLQLLDAKDGEPLATVSARLGVSPAKDCVWMCGGLLEALEVVGAVKATGRTTPVGRGVAAEARVLV